MPMASKPPSSNRKFFVYFPSSHPVNVNSIENKRLDENDPDIKIKTSMYLCRLEGTQSSMLSRIKNEKTSNFDWRKYLLRATKFSRNYGIRFSMA